MLHLPSPKNLEIQTISDFSEREIGTWIDNFSQFSKQQWTDFNFKLENGESLKEVQERNISALEKFLNEFPNQNIIIGTHGTTLSTIINFYDENFLYDDFEKQKDKMPHIIEMNFEKTECLSYQEIDGLE